jgi:UDP-N-acetyl-2-amino-2-deoxyglucuronate dehydrogenase
MAGNPLSGGRPLEPVGVALVGLGKIAATHAEAYASTPRARLVGVYDEAQEPVRTFVERYGCRPYSSLEEALDDTAVQVIDICTPHPTHARIAIRAAARGRHVLVEKPMAPTLEDCDAMIAAATRGGVHIGVISQRRWYEPVQRVRRAITDGKLGKPVLAVVTLLGWRDQDYYRLAAWRGTWAGEGGGVMVNQASHHLDLLHWLMGPAEEVFGYWANLNHPTIEVEDTAVAVLRFSSGALGSIVLSNSQRPGLYGRVHVHGSNGASVGVQTETGSAFVAGVTTHVEPAFNDLWTIPGEEGMLAGWQRDDRDEAARVDPMTYYHHLQIGEFIDAIADGRSPRVTGDDGRSAVELFAAVYESQRTMAPVRLPMRTSVSPATGMGMNPTRQ